MHCSLRPAGHLHSQATAINSAQPNDRLPGSPNISMLSPELQQQWDVERNMHLGSIRIKPQSSRKVVWRSDKSPAGQPHIWTAGVQHRTRGTQCRYCSNRRLCVHNSLATIAPDGTQYWKYSKNEKAPKEVLAGSNVKAEWKCPICNLEWQACIRARVRNRSGCPKCSRANRVIQSQPTFLEAQPACLARWDYERNDAEEIYPDNVTLGSKKQVHWVCACCPRGQPYRWTARPSGRISSSSGCAVCAGHQACVCNSLESLFPLIAAELDVDQNGFASSEITARSGKEVWWRNAKHGS